MLFQADAQRAGGTEWVDFVLQSIYHNVSACFKINICNITMFQFVYNRKIRDHVGGGELVKSDAVALRECHNLQKHRLKTILEVV